MYDDLNDGISEYHDIIVYGQDNCTGCKTACSLLEAKNIPYTYLELGKHITKEKFFELFPNARSVPVVTINGENIGGLMQLKSRLHSSIGSSIDASI